MDLSYDLAPIAPQSDRDVEATLLARAADMLDAVGTGDPAARDVRRVQAAAFVRRLWAVLIEDLGRADNALPERVRADLVSVGLRMVRLADALAAGDETGVGEMHDVMRDIARGLAPAEAAA